MLRLLLVEDDPDRITRFTAWCPPDARLVVARGGGRALGLLERDPGRVYAGLLLDHDLPGQAVNDAERLVTGTQVVQGVLRCLDPEIPILIHSMNRGAARRMATTLTAGGFEVSVIPMTDLTQDRFLAWLDTVREVQRLFGPE
jgi:CheY-like chemotaxis protein